MADDIGLPRPADDAVSLHTIADHEIYATQEQEDADFALALSLEEEEQDRAQRVSQLTAEAQEREALIARERGQRGRPNMDGAPAPYRDDPDDGDASPFSDDNLPPYRDDPEAAIEDTDRRAEVPVKVRWWRRCIGRCADWAGNLKQRPTARLSRPAKIVLGIAVILIFAFPTLYGISLLFEAPEHPRSQPSPSAKEPAFEASGSRNGYLVLRKLYPDLEEGVSKECRAAWEEHASALRCHQGILSSVWDRGDGDLIKKTGMDIWAYGQLVCDEYKTCEKQTHLLEKRIGEACTLRSDRFDLDGFQLRELKYFEDSEVEPSPLQVAQNLKARYESLCDRPANRPYKWNQIILGTYPAQLWKIWGIADGKDAAKDLRYLDTFLDATSEAKTINRTKLDVWAQVEGKTLREDSHMRERRVGPGKGETTCYHSIVSWMDRKMSSFEYGAVMDPKTGIPLSLTKFNEKMENALRRCEEPEALQVVERVHKMWKEYGWCSSRSQCREESISENIVRLLHGLKVNEYPLPQIREVAKRPSTKPTTKRALRAMYDSLLQTPCSIWVSPQEILSEIMPSDYRIHKYCSNECRNDVVDRMRQKTAAIFDKLSHDDEGSELIWDWQRALKAQNMTCKGPEYNEIVTETTVFCAPGYAAIERSAWLLFPRSAPSKKYILEAFAPHVDTLAASFPEFMRSPEEDEEAQRRLARRMSESVCNKCLRPLLLGGKEGQDDGLDELEYKRVKALYSMTCAKIEVGSTLAKEPQVRKRLGLE